MITELREFNDDGIRQFRDYFNKIKNNDIGQDFTELLTDDLYTSIIKTDACLEPKLPASKLQTASYLHHIIAPLSLENKFYRQGLWTWLAAFYFDSVCPVKEDGTRSVGSEERYILIPGRVIYRHLLAGPVQIFDSYGNTSQILLSGDTAVMGDYIEQLAGRIYITSSKGNVQAVDLLYWDSEKKQPIQGSTSRKKPGNIRRFADIINQFRLTYDLTLMDGFEIVELLPKEFDKYRQNITEYLYE
jgi:hypothetical protein